MECGYEAGRMGNCRIDTLGHRKWPTPSPLPYGQHHGALGMVQSNHVGQMGQHTVAAGRNKGQGWRVR